MNTAHPIQPGKTLGNYRREELESYMIDCHSFSSDDVEEWDTKEDLIADIRSFGWEKECLEYLA